MTAGPVTTMLHLAAIDERTALDDHFKQLVRGVVQPQWPRAQPQEMSDA